MAWSAGKAAGLAALLGLLLLGPARADSVDTGFQGAMTELANAMFREGLGLQREARIYVRQPRDDVYGVACAPLSRLIRRKYNKALRQGLRNNGLERAEIVGRASAEPGQLVVNLTWRRLNDTHYDIATSIALGTESDTFELYRDDFPALVSDLNEIETRCLFRLDEVHDYLTAARPIIVYQSIGNFRDELGRIEAEQDYLLIGRIEGMGNWTLVRMLDRDGGPEVETLGFANIRGEGETREALEAALGTARAELAAAREALAEREARIAGQSARIAELESVAGELDETRAALAAAEDRARRIEAELEGRITELTKQIALLEGAGDTAERELTEQVDRAEREARLLRRQLDRAEADLEAARGETARLRGEMAREVYAREQAEAARTALAEAIAGHEAEAERLAAELAELRRTAPENREAIRRLERRLESQARELEAAREQVRRQAEETREREARVAKLERENAALRTRLAARETRPAPRPVTPPRPPLAADRVRIHRQIDFDNADAAWLDRQTVRDVDHERCKAICLGDKGCKYYTYNTKTDVCYTKSGYTARKPYRFAISGEVTSRIGR